MPRKRGVPKTPQVIRLTDEAKSLLARLAAKSGLSLAAYMETLIRREAKREKVDADE
jgi:hypothetical protein